MSPVGTVVWNEILREAARKLSGAGVDDPMRDARQLLAHNQGIAADRVTLVSADIATKDEIARFEALIGRRAQREPVSHIIGSREFYGRRFKVTPEVLDPRPETEHLIEVALEQSFNRILDLGTGSGAILFTLLAERHSAAGLGTDISTDAINVAEGNASMVEVSDRIELIQSDWYDQVDGKFDLIVSNPPYIARTEMVDLAPEVRHHEPHIALTPGGDGLDAYRAITAGVMEHLTPGGRLIVEIGPTQALDVMEMFKAAGLHDIRVTKDLDQRDRVVIGNNPR